jgi:Helix-turn-helix domain
MSDLAPLDTRAAQSGRVADFLERHPKSTAKEIDAVCDTGSITKVLSDMPRRGYGIAKTRRYETCAGGKQSRRVRVYSLLYRPSTQPDLFKSE